MRSYGAKRDGNEDDIKTALRRDGWSVFSMSQPGVPDLLCVKRHHSMHEVRFVEVKERGANLTPKQLATFPILAAMGLRIDVVEDENHLSGTPWNLYRKGRAA